MELQWRSDGAGGVQMEELSDGAAVALDGAAVLLGALAVICGRLTATIPNRLSPL